MYGRAERDFSRRDEISGGASKENRRQCEEIDRKKIDIGVRRWMPRRIDGMHLATHGRLPPIGSATDWVTHWVSDWVRIGSRTDPGALVVVHSSTLVTT